MLENVLPLDMFSALMLLAAGLAGAISVYVWQYRFHPSVTTFFLFMVCETQWFLCIGLWSLARQPNSVIFWFKFQFLGVASIPVLFLIYVLQNLGRQNVMSPIQWVPLWIIPFITQIAAWTNDQLGWLFASIPIIQAKDQMFSLGQWEPGPWFLVHSAYSFALIAIAIVLLIKHIRKTSGLYRQQSLWTLIAISIPILTTLLNVFQVLAPRQSITPLAFLTMGIIMVWNIFRNQWLFIIPIARNVLMDHMSDIILVVDAGCNLVDYNFSALTILNMPDKHFGEQTQNVLPGNLRSVVIEFQGKRSHQLEIELFPGEHYEIRVTPLFRHNHAPIGYLLVLRDITELKKAHQELFQWATVDPLTQLFNRRHTLEQGHFFFEQAIQQDQPFSVILFDVDHFKKINDDYGHHMGDQVLSGIGQAVQQVIRHSDLAGRFGGEEFIVFQPQTQIQEAFQVGERLRNHLSCQPFANGTHRFYITVSIGITALRTEQPMSFDQLLHQADMAMYYSKRTGRNRTTTYTPERV